MSALAKIASLAAAGMGVGMIINETGLTKSAVYHHARKQGVDVRGGQLPYTVQSIRAMVQDMRPTEAADYLLTIVEELAGDQSDMDAAQQRLGLVGQQARAYCALSRQAGRIVSFDALGWVITTDPTEPASKEALTVIMSRVRNALPENERITAARGRGYRLERT
ncbi:helix-turn-helix domain-containing protein [Paracoccus fontiphilus]|uniref:Helix-turn-helix domain-containing protein n=1 Tax=Paracoccus fontiphilus TaxID=1815556 RepID=A0ABV7IJ76_9RHOB|nr:helix-turn-helix domain-containing protein [Paracoccus fontiphilus]